MSLTAYRAPKPNSKLEQVQISKVYKGMRVSLLMFCLDNFIINGKLINERSTLQDDVSLCYSKGAPLSVGCSRLNVMNDDSSNYSLTFSSSKWI